MPEIYNDDCLVVLRELESNSIDSGVMDPPAGISFMGKEWDHDKGGRDMWIAWMKEVMQEVYRVIKPGGHILVWALPRTSHWTATACEDAGWEIRDVVSHVFGCLSADSEILTDHGWEHYQNLAIGQHVLCYNVSTDTYDWQPIQEVVTYDYDDTAYRIHSDHTDQLVSRNHRCLVEREGTYVFEYAEEVARQQQARVPILEDLPALLKSISLRDKGTGSSKKSLLERMCLAIAQTGKAAHAKAASSMPNVRSAFCNQITVIQSSKILLSTMLQPMAQNITGCSSTYAKNSIERQRQIATRQGLTGREKPGVEGWRNIFQNARKLFYGEICSMPYGLSTDGSEGRIHNGTSIDSSKSDWQATAALGSSPSYRSRSDEQFNRQSSAIQKQSGSQTVRVSRHTRSDMADITPVNYKGIVWCVRVPSGAFVARRNGKVFVTGNSGFPKSLNVSKQIDAMAGAEREVVGDNPNHRPISGVNYEGVYAGGNTGAAQITAPATDEAKQWDGWGTALKPSTEHWILCRKPLSEPTVAKNVLKYGTGAINIGACKVGTEQTQTTIKDLSAAHGNQFGKAGIEYPSIGVKLNTPGRWPANLTLSHSPLCALVGQDRVKAPVINRWDDGSKPFGGGAGHSFTSEQQGDADGMETVDKWECPHGQAITFSSYEGTIGAVSPVDDAEYLLDQMQVLIQGLREHNMNDNTLLRNALEFYRTCCTESAAKWDDLCYGVSCALNLLEVPGFQFGYQSCRDLCDAHVHRILNACQDGIPSLLDALVTVHADLYSHVHSLSYQSNVHQSSSDDALPAYTTPDNVENRICGEIHSSTSLEQVDHIVNTKQSAQPQTENHASSAVNNTFEFYSRETSHRIEGTSAAVKLLCLLSYDLAWRFLLPAAIIQRNEITINLPVCPIRELDNQAGMRKSGTGAKKKQTSNGHQGQVYGKENRPAGTPNIEYGDNGSVSRFFYVSKASKRDKTANGRVANSHPTVKSTDLMRYLCRLITPPNGTILDAFMGSGSTGVAAIEEGFDFIGIEKDEESYDTACQRISIAWEERSRT